MGVIHNQQQYRKLTDCLFEFKGSAGGRVIWFYDGKEQGRIRILCTHAFLKKGRKCPPSEITKAQNLRNRYYNL
jgi:hypothetical protein